VDKTRIWSYDNYIKPTFWLHWCWERFWGIALKERYTKCWMNEWNEWIKYLKQAFLKIKIHAYRFCPWKKPSESQFLRLRPTRLCLSLSLSHSLSLSLSLSFMKPSWHLFMPSLLVKLWLDSPLLHLFSVFVTMLWVFLSRFLKGCYTN